MLINDMTPAQAADILAILPRDEAEQILTLIDPDKSSRSGASLPSTMSRFSTTARRSS